VRVLCSTCESDAAIVVEAQGASDVQLMAIAQKVLERLPR